MEGSMSWQVDYPHTGIRFSAKHMMISTVRGEFTKFTVDANLNEAEIGKIHDSSVLEEEDILESKLDVKIEAASISTHDARRDDHLRSADFLNVEKFPYVHFTARRGEKIDDKHGKLFGDLTIRGVTKPVTLEVEFLGEAKGPWSHNAGFTAQTTINRKDWGLNWNVALETGGWLVSEHIKIEIDIEFIKVPETVPAELAIA